MLTVLTQTGHRRSCGLEEAAYPAAYSTDHGLEAMSDISYYYVSHPPNGACQ